VDHGKSTVIGRLLADTHSLPAGKLEQVRQFCTRNAKPFEYAFLLDALKDERAQGITIDAARAFFRTATRRYIIVDVPGHIEFLKNMVSGASRADAALVVIDAAEGIQENSRRHGYLLSMLGVRQVVVLVNKIDLVGYERTTFEAISGGYRAFLDQVGIRPRHIIPVAAREGHNIADASDRMGWFCGPTLLQALEEFTPHPPAVDAPFRLPVQGVYKFTEGGDARRIIAGTVACGRVRVGDTIIFYPSGKQTAVATIEGFGRSPGREASAGEATGFTMTEQVYVARGEVAALADEPAPCVTTRLKAQVFWLGKRPLVTTRPYQLKLGAGRVSVQVTSIERVIDLSTLEPMEHAGEVQKRQVAECTLELARPLAFDLLPHVPALARFVIVDSYEIAGGGIVQEPLTEQASTNQAGEGRRAPGDAHTAPRIDGAVLWFTGLSGSGKTTIATEVYRDLQGRGAAVEYLDGDAIRALFPGVGFGPSERDAHLRRVAFLASRLAHHGVIVITAFISPYRDSRAYARSLCRNFVEIHVATPLEVCEARDPKGLYAKARRGEIRQFTGVDDPYETPLEPELVIDTTELPVRAAAIRVLEQLHAIRGGTSPAQV